MQAIPFLLIHLFMIVRLALVPIAYITIVVLVGNFLFRSSRATYKIIFILILTLAPIALFINGYYAFREICREKKFADFSTNLREKVDGFLDRSAPWPYNSTAPTTLLKEGRFKYIEEEFSDGNKQGYLTWTSNGQGATFIKERKSRYDFEITPPKAVSPILRPGFLISKIRIVNSINGKTIAQSTEYMFGGGQLGQYIAYISNGWNQGDDMYSCGYIDKNTHKSRPVLYQEYSDKDSEFIQKVLMPNKSAN